MIGNDLTHCVSSICAAPAEVAFAYLADAARLGEWALGCWAAVATSDGVVEGRSLFDGAPAAARALPDDERLIVDYEIGQEAGSLVRRITSRVVPGEALGLDHSRTLVILLAWRTAAMDDERWGRLVASHDAEILLLRGRIEAEAAS